MTRARSEDQGPQAACPAVEIRFPSCAEYLALLRQIMEWFTERCGFPEIERSRIVLAVVEATTNIIRHAYEGDPSQRITLCVRQLPDALELEFLDTGRSTGPQGLQGKDPGQLEPGGLGVRMMKSCMDDFQYSALPEGGARLILRKRYPAEGKGLPTGRGSGKEGG